MSKSLSFENLKPYLFLVFCVSLVVLMSSEVFATTAQDMPWEEPLTKVKNSITGPVATALSVFGIVGAGAALVFGGDMNGFLRGLIILVLVIALIIGGNNLVTGLFKGSAMVSVTDIVNYYRC